MGIEALLVNKLAHSKPEAPVKLPFEILLMIWSLE